MKMLPIDMFWSILPDAMQKIEAASRTIKIDAATIQAASVSRELPLTIDGDIGIIPMDGPMEKRGSIFSELFGFVSTERARMAVEQAAHDPAISTIVLRIDSPGGSVDGLSELGDAVFAARQVKPVIAQVDGMMASAALYVGAQATKVFAGRTDLIGSIGTKLVLLDTSKLFEEAGIKVVAVDTGAMKSAGEPGTEITDDQVEFFQSIVDQFFDDFLKAVTRGRGMTSKAVRAIADGRFWMAPEAKGLGLIDKVQTFAVTVADLRAKSERRRSNRTARNQIALDMVRAQN